MIDPIEAIGPKKRKKVQIPPTPLQEFVWRGSLAPHDFGRLILDAQERVVSKASRMSREVRQDHEAESFWRHKKSLAVRKNFDYTNLVRIHPS